MKDWEISFLIIGMTAYDNNHIHILLEKIIALACIYTDTDTFYLNQLHHTYYKCMWIAIAPFHAK